MIFVRQSGKPSTMTAGVLACVLVFFALTWPLVRPDSATTVQGFFSFLARFWVAPDWEYLPKMIGRFWESILIAWVATVVSCFLSFPFAFLGSNIAAPARWTIAPVRWIAAVLRAIPDLVLALLLASAMGLGSGAGVIALVVSSIGFLVKNYSDSFDSVQPGPIEGVKASGASWLGERTIGVLPQAAPDMVSLSLYQLDVNVRASTILGAVGAGGIGYDITQSVRLFHFDRLGPILICIYIVITIIDRVSTYWRTKLR